MIFKTDKKKMRIMGTNPSLSIMKGLVLPLDDGEVLNKGKTYAEYVEEEKEREWENRKDIAETGI